MYEDRTQDVIVAEMLENFGKDVRTDENSLAYNACVKTASELEDAYGDIMDIYDNMLPGYAGFKSFDSICSGKRYNLS